jgi:hypothetical protein
LLLEELDVDFFLVALANNDADSGDGGGNTNGEGVQPPTQNPN